MNIMALGDICEVTAGQSAPQDPTVFGDKGKPFIRAGSLENLINGGAEEDCELISDERAVLQRLRLFPKDTILFAKSGMSAKLGRVHRLRVPSYVVSHLAAVTPGKKVDPSYLKRWFEKNPPSRLIPNEAYPSIRISEISRLKIELLPLSEQKRIATILDKADSIRFKRHRAIQFADEFLRSVFLDMFGDPVINTKDWPEYKLDQISEIVSGVTKGRKFIGKKTIFVPYMRVANVQDGHINIDDVQEIEVLETDVDKYRLEKGDILLTEGGDPDKLGRGAVWKGEIDPCIHQNHIFRVRSDNNKVFPEFLSALIGSGRGKRYFLKAAKQTTGVASINKTQLRNFPALVPPLSFQQKYLSAVIKIEGIKDKIKSTIDNADSLFNSIAQRAFSGEL